LATPLLSFTNNNWLHLALTYDFDSDIFSLYLNGSLVDNRSTLLDPFIITSNITIGSNISLKNQANGSMDELRISNVARTPEKIARSFEPLPNRLGFETEAFYFVILANNTKENLINQSQNVSYLSEEIIRFNYTKIGYDGIDYNSTTVYDQNFLRIPHQKNGSNVTFVTNISINETKQFYVYFDDDSNFDDNPSGVNGEDNITEEIYPVHEITLLQYQKLMDLNTSNYTKIKDSLDIKSEFRIEIIDTKTNLTFMSFGKSLPKEVDISALQAFALFQNITADIINGKVIFRTWKE